MIGTLADKLKVPAGAVIDTLVAESGGAAFASDGRLVIRFEVHLFYRYWGEQNQAVFNRFFSFDRSSAANGFKNHMWRPNIESEFQFFHGKSSREWDVLTFARALNDTAALKSISMGMSQVVGFNYKVIGYESVQQMFEQFARSAHAQILALFDYVKGPSGSSPVITAMQNGDFVAFARAYNGPANTAVYSERIKTNSDVFNRLISSAKTVSAPVTTTRGPDGQSTEPATPAPEPNNAHLHMEIHLSSGFDSLLNPKHLAARKLLKDFERPQPASNQVPWNPVLFFSKRLIKYMQHQSRTVGFYGKPSYPTSQTLQSLSAGHLPPLDFFTLGYYEYGGGIVWVNSGKPWPAGVITSDILASRLQAFTPFEAYPAKFLK